MGIFHVFAIEATEDNNFLLINLGYSKTLTSWEYVLRQLNELPLILGDIVELFNGVDILFRLIWYSTEYIDESVMERTAGMIVTAFSELWDVEPDIKIDVVAFSSELS